MNKLNKLLLTSALTALSFNALAVDITDTDVTLSRNSNDFYEFTESGSSDAYRTFTIDEGVTLSVTDDDQEYAVYGDDSHEYLQVINNGEIIARREFDDDFAAIDFYGQDVTNSIIRNNGLISVATSYDYELFGIHAYDHTTIINAGIIDVTAVDEYAYGISAVDDNTITNSGTIRVSNTDDYAYGIEAEDDNIITNTGRIEVSNVEYDAFGINVDDDNTIINSGVIDVLGDDDRVKGISGDKNNTIINSGTINAVSPSDNAYGIDGGEGNTVTNYGSITAYSHTDVAYGIDGGEGNTVTNYGSINVTSSGDNFYGIKQNYIGGKTITNSGIINLVSENTGSSYEAHGISIGSGTGTGSGGVFSQAGTVINSGSIVASVAGIGESGDESRAYGIKAYNGDDTDNRLSIINSGIINATAYNSDAYGIETYDHNNVTNSGTINTHVTNGSESWGKSKGISVGEDEDTISVTNSGIINAQYTGASSSAAAHVWGIDIEYGGSAINTGSISATINQGAGNAYGISSQLENPDTGSRSLTITNSGVINASAKSGDAYGIVAFGGDKTVYLNAGTVINASSESGDAYAVAFTDGVNNTDSENNVVYLSSAAVIKGKIKFASGENNVLYVDDQDYDDSNIHYQYEGVDDHTHINEKGITLRGSIVKVSEGGFAMMNEVTNQIVGGIDDSVTGRLLNIHGNENQNAYWVKAFGKYQERPKVGHVAQSDAMSSGLMLGFDKNINEKTRAGVFAGGIGGKLKTGKTRTNNKDKSIGFTIGGYGDYKFKNGFVANLITSAGYLDHDNDRYVSHGEDGQKTMNSSYKEYFISPTLNLYKKFAVKDFNIVPSLAVGYLGQKFSSYNENRSDVSAIGVGSRFVSTVREKAQVSFVYDKKFTDKKAKVNLDLGIEARQQVGKRNVKVTQLNTGSANDYKLQGAKNFTDAFVGVGLNLAKKKNVLIYADTKVNKGLNYSGKDNFGISASAGLRINF